MPDSLDIEQPELLLAYLREIRRIDSCETPRFTHLTGGVSNRAVLVERENGDAWVLKQALAKLRVAADWFSDPARIEREALGLRYLVELAPPGTITPLVFEDAAQHLLAMQAVAKPHDNWKTLLLGGRIEASHVRQFAELLAAIHRRSWERRAELAPLFDNRTFFDSLRLEPYYAFAATRVPEAADFLSCLIDDTRARRFAVVHGDYSPKNILVQNDRLILLDHEVIHFGDPAFDLGFSLTHLLSKARHLPAARAAFADAAVQYWNLYRDRIGNVPWATDLESFAIRHTIACMLARVAGKSPLEYLDSAEQDRQRAAVLKLIANPVKSIDRMIRLVVNDTTP